MKTTITRFKGGTLESEVPVNEIKIPDLWHLSEKLRNEFGIDAGNEVLEVWHLAHDLLRHIKKESR